MADHQKTRLRPLWKRAVIWLVQMPWLNVPLVTVLKALGWPKWRERLPVVRGVGQIALSNKQEITLLNPVRCNVAREIWWNDGQLSSGADRNALDLALALSQDAKQFLDVGSYTGLFALSVAKSNPTIQCHAFEIIPENFSLLTENIIRNDLIQNITTHLHGVSDTSTTMQSPIAFEAGLLPSSASLGSNYDHGITVPVDRLDTLVPTDLGKTVIKIDVEGFEGHVLKGAEGLITSCKPDIICEFLTNAPDIPAIQHFLSNFGYRFLRITENGLQLGTTITPIKTERDWLLTVRTDAELADLGWPVS